MSAQSDWTAGVRHLQRTEQFAKTIAPSFRERFDFSDPSHFKTCSDLTFDLASALARKFQDEEDALRAKFEPAYTLEVQAAAKAKAEADASAASAAEKARHEITPATPAIEEGPK